MKTFKTIKGTEIPILNLRGKDYLEVKYRLVWFREEHPDWSIETEFIKIGDDFSMAKATVKDKEGRVLSTGHKYEDKKGFADYHEKSESGAIGRALALLGYGTQFTDDLDEGERIVDSPVTEKPKQQAQQKPTINTAKSKPIPEVFNDINYGELICNIGRKFKGNKIKDIPIPALENYLKWLKDESDKSGKDLSGQTKDFYEAGISYLYSIEQSNKNNF